MDRNSSHPLPARRRRVRLRTSLAAVLAWGGLVLTGCGDPEDDSGGGGGGYVAGEQIAS